VSDIKALVVGELSLVEQRNVEQLEAWAIACTVPGGSAARLVDEVYADQPEVVSVLTGTYVARVGLSKRAWREAEEIMEARYVSRRIVFTAVHPRGDTIAVEARIEQVLKDGTQRGWPFAVFLAFDSSARIVSDHTYMLPHPNQDDLDRAAAAVERAGGHDYGL
jgi:hypothetical protein